jgi:hypothetical protein
MMKKQTIVWSLLAVVLLLLLTGCSGEGDAGDSGSSSVSLGGEESAGSVETTTDSAQDTAADSAQDTVAGSGQDTVDQEEQESEESTSASESEASDSEPQAEPFIDSLGLEQLSSYEADIFLEFEGARGEATNDVPMNQVQNYILTFNRDPHTRYQSTFIKSEGGMESENETEMYLADDVTYTYTFGNWIAQSGLFGFSQFTHPTRFAYLPETAVCADQPEDVNGVSAIPCTFGNEDLDAVAFEQSDLQGTVWVAEDGGYVVRYELEVRDMLIKGRFPGFSAMDTYRTGYTLSKVNEPIEITVPAEAQGTEVLDMTNMGAMGESSGLAVPDNVDVVLDNSATLIYFADRPIADLIEFHRDELTAAGWEAIPEDSYIESGSGLAVFENESGILRVFGYEDVDGGFFVTVTLPFDTPGSVDEGTAGGDAGAASDLPVMPDAENQFSMGEILSYSSPSDVDAVLSFYRDELPGLGWSENESVSFSDETNGFMTFEQGDQTLMVTATQGQDGKTVVALTFQ